MLDKSKIIKYNKTMENINRIEEISELSNSIYFAIDSQSDYSVWSEARNKLLVDLHILINRNIMSKVKEAINEKIK